MQAIRATRRASVARCWASGGLDALLGRGRGHSRERREETWSNSVEGSRGSAARDLKSASHSR